MQTYFTIGMEVEVITTSKKYKHIKRLKRFTIQRLDNLDVYDEQNNHYPINNIRKIDNRKPKRKKKSMFKEQTKLNLE